jgi:hypothetical protein
MAVVLFLTINPEPQQCMARSDSNHLNLFNSYKKPFGIQLCGTFAVQKKNP